ncbi:hypothetical protein HYH03_005717 [Edaphochlamys debaryana]|uniref:NADPH--hemoprotein reductase n=1 Tax=Edaphochlamys debaryana TaxID=47281 RepID=A0A835YEG9_9CHLO|nr:hypothetical protein HYH03_005717 [Edaphochlamys debaryana]|eukprot:KAG2496114.1 hypothetical protein HYH03_005717 [Edaphochlamys debaryana]
MATLTLLLVAAAVVIAALALLSIRSKLGRQQQLSATPPVARRESIEDTSRPIVRILFGTQTGTAERFSKQLGNELRSRYGESTSVDVRDVETYKSERLASEKCVVLCMATYGDGEPTDNAAVFYNWLLKEAEAVDAGEKEASLTGVSYAVFGLGNKQYEHFNAVGKKVFKSLKTLGATPVCRRGDGDDDGVIDDDFEKWTAEFLDALDKSDDLVGKRIDQNGGVHTVSVPTYAVDVLPAGSASAAQPFPSGTGKDVHSPFWAKITTVKELHTSQSDRSCVHVEVDVSGSGISYEAGDHIAVFAQNGDDIVAKVAELLGFDLNALIRVSLPANTASANDLPPPFPGPLSVKTALAYFADVLSTPHRDALAALSTFAADREEAAKLALMGSTSPAGKAEFSKYIGTTKRSLLEVLQAFPSAKPTIGAFFGCIAPRLQPRFYSISSSPKPHPTSVHITCAVVRDEMPTGRIHEGVASTWLARHGAGTTVPVFVRHSHFRLPKAAETPVVMVGPGTGLAPFRGFLQERAALSASGAKLGPAHLFFGCRSRAHDYIYQAELEGFLAGGVLSDLHLAFSREASAKDYVQHHIERRGADLWALLERGAHLYVCGDAKHMAKDVHRAIIALVQAGRGCSGTEAEGFVKELTDSGRYQRDVW